MVSGKVGAGEAPQAVVSTTTAISSPRKSASRSFETALCSTSASYPLLDIGACGLPAMNLVRQPDAPDIRILSHLVYPRNTAINSEHLETERLTEDQR
jgi:hypothetical protein